MGPALVSRSARRRRRCTGAREARRARRRKGAGGGAWSRRGPAEHRSAGSRRHGERGPGQPATSEGRAAPRRAGAAPGSRGAAGRARRTPTGYPPPQPLRALRLAPGGRLRAAVSPGFTAVVPAAPSPLTPPPFLPPSSPPPASPPFLPCGFCFVNGLGGGRLCGARGWSESLPPPLPPGGSHLSGTKMTGALGPAGQPGHGRMYLRARPPLPQPARRGREGGRPAGRKGKSPSPRAQVSIPPRVGPVAGHTCQLERLHSGSPAKFRV